MKALSQLSLCSSFMYTAYKPVNQSNYFPAGGQNMNFLFVCHSGLSFLEGKEDITADWREKFLNTYKVRL